MKAVEKTLFKFFWKGGAGPYRKGNIIWANSKGGLRFPKNHLLQYWVKTPVGKKTNKGRWPMETIHNKSKPI